MSENRAMAFPESPLVTDLRLGDHIWVLPHAFMDRRIEGIITALAATGKIELNNDTEHTLDLNLAADFGFVTVEDTPDLLTPVGDVRMNAYYYGFDKTGIAVIDQILSAIATAGKHLHSTEDWADDDHTYHVGGMNEQQHIQAAADAAARAIRTHLATGR